MTICKSKISPKLFFIKIINKHSALIFCTNLLTMHCPLLLVSYVLQGDGLQLEYEMKLTNGQSFWTQHFSADEFGKSD